MKLERVEVGPSTLGRVAGDQPTVELRFVNALGKTEVWMVETNRGLLDLMEQMAEVNGFGPRIRLAFLDHDVDARLGRQVESINRLLDHVNFHHTELAEIDRKEFALQDYACSYEETL